MNEFMEARSFKQIVVPGTHELVFVKAVTDKADLEIRMYSSVTLGGMSRGVGSDAKVYRVQGWRNNLETRLLSINEQVNHGLIKCRCGEWMVLREGKFGKFYGCIKYPDCKETRKGR
jgi:hypothetical protein